ncbi:MAG: TonB-dependent hemoglobin/transferrin/lactoferrin family receptor [Pseudomonadota bacterium]
MRPNLLSLAVFCSLAAAANAAHADGSDSPEGAAAPELDRVVVVATRSERTVEDVPNTVDAIDRETMDAHLVRDLKDLFRYEPGISVGSSFGRFGLGDIRIRGLGGNRVLIQTDGIPVSDAFAIGSFSNANRNFVDLDTLKQVEVLRGPGSALYGSDALGGVVSFRTKDPADYLVGGKSHHVGFKLGYESDWNGLFGGATLAGGGERWSWLVSAGHRQGEAQENQGSRDVDGVLRTTPNPQERDGRSLLAKLVYAPSDRQRLRLTVEGNEDATDTDVRSALGFSALTGATTLMQAGDDRQTRARVALEHEIDAAGWGWADTLRWSVYRQDSETTQDTVEERRLASGTRQRRQRSFNFDQRLVGVEAMFGKDLQTGRVLHTLSYGLEATRTDTRQKRDGLATNLSTGVSTPVVPPDVFPVRDFPVTRVETAALFVQDEIVFGDGDFRLVPALRVDRYELHPEVDAIFAADNPGVAVSDLTETSLSPKLGMVWRFAPNWSLFAGYARGFRAPPYNDANIGFTNLAGGYTAIANPDLKPETSDGFEAGLRYSGDAVWFSLAGYDNRYRDFIESLRFIGVNDAGLLVFQSQNVADARIYGVELKGGIDFGAMSERLQGWSLRGAAAYARGEDRTADRPIDSIDPLRGSLGLAFERERWGAELAGSFAQRKHRVSDVSRYQPAGYGVWDAFAYWSFAPGAKLNLGVFNLGDKRYTDWADVPGVAATSAILDRYTRPGRNVAASVSFAW